MGGIHTDHGSTAFRYTPICDERETGTYHRQVANLSFSLFLSITFRLIPPQLSLMVLLFMNMKDNIQLTASLSSYRYYYFTSYVHVLALGQCVIVMKKMPALCFSFH